MLDTLVVTLLLTLPNTLAATEWIRPELRDSPEDSIRVTCDPGFPLTDLDSIRFYAIPATGGPWRRVYAKGVRGREGQSDSTTLTFLGWTGAHFYVVTTRIGSALESCASQTAYKGTVTGVDLPPPTVPTAAVLVWYDVQGRKLRGRPKATGLYFAVWYVNGRSFGAAQKVPVFEGRELVRLRPP